VTFSCARLAPRRIAKEECRCDDRCAHSGRKAIGAPPWAMISGPENVKVRGSLDSLQTTFVREVQDCRRKYSLKEAPTRADLLLRQF
jgi:hypothetical protein